jgi:hypothetical protein
MTKNLAISKVNIAAATLRMARKDGHPLISKPGPNPITRARADRDEAVQDAYKAGASIDEISAAARITGKAVKKIINHRLVTA